MAGHLKQGRKEMWVSCGVHNRENQWTLGQRPWKFFHRNLKVQNKANYCFEWNFWTTVFWEPHIKSLGTIVRNRTTWYEVVILYACTWVSTFFTIWKLKVAFHHFRVNRRSTLWVVKSWWPCDPKEFTKSESVGECPFPRPFGERWISLRLVCHRLSQNLRSAEK